MAFWKKKDDAGAKATRVFFATDIHGSERTFRKFLNGAKFYKVDHIIMGGDITGKFLVPIVHEHDSHYRVTLQGTTESIEGDSALQAVKERIETLGFYHVTLEEDALHAMQENPGEIDSLFRRLGRERLERWIALADERLAGTTVKWYVTGGNDDPMDVLSVLENIESDHVINCGGRGGGAGGIPGKGGRGHRRLHEHDLQLPRAALRLHIGRLPQAGLVHRSAHAGRGRRGGTVRAGR
ncbi:MAG: hypothetical protein NTW58_06070 [Actinobacteria bacterium]|nr:hypothetical protein [Actinomycetota bacterium]